MNETSLTPENLQQALATAQLQKLNLEIEGLKHHSSWPETLVKLTPLLSVLIAVGGLLWGVYQYRQEQQKTQTHEETSQRIQIQAKMREDLDQIVRFPTNKAETLSRTKFLLKDLNTLLQLHADSIKDSNGSTENSGREVSSILYDVANDDCDFDKQRDAEFALALLDSWDDYKNYVKETPNTASDLLAKYFDALAKLHTQIPRFVSNIKYNDDQSEYIHPVGTTSTEESHLRLFEALIRGVKKHLDLLDSGSDLRKSLVKDFQISICNEHLTKQLFNLSFDPKNDQESFSSCLKVSRRR